MLYTLRKNRYHYCASRDSYRLYRPWYWDEVLISHCNKGLDLSTAYNPSTVKLPDMRFIGMLRILLMSHVLEAALVGSGLEF